MSRYLQCDVVCRRDGVMVQTQKSPARLVVDDLHPGESWGRNLQACGISEEMFFCVREAKADLSRLKTGVASTDAESAPRCPRTWGGMCRISVHHPGANKVGDRNGSMWIHTDLPGWEVLEVPIPVHARSEIEVEPNLLLLRLYQTNPAAESAASLKIIRAVPVRVSPAAKDHAVLCESRTTRTAKKWLFKGTMRKDITDTGDIETKAKGVIPFNIVGYKYQSSVSVLFDCTVRCRDGISWISCDGLFAELLLKHVLL